MKTLAYWFLGGSLIGFSCAGPQHGAEFVSTTADVFWEMQAEVQAETGVADVVIDTALRQQTIEGFGACFNELGWTSLSLLKPEAREAVMNELFAPGQGANFTICRMPVGANDFSLDWYR